MSSREIPSKLFLIQSLSKHSSMIGQTLLAHERDEIRSGRERGERQPFFRRARSP